MPEIDQSIPPQSPDVSAQQSEESPLAQYAQRQAGAQQKQEPTGIGLIELRLNEIEQKLSDVAQVAAMVNPAYGEYVKKMAQVGALFMREVQSQKQKQTQGQGPMAGLEPSRAAAEGPSSALAA
jgi:hypothetical protein